ncbi:MAG TPA: ABC transporter substrate-binding protein, partial [Candidatus Paceibacterota bacterium]|nr:ABC transporter substrate-binding protein [Candidatus Paceibacterota bacterium]
MTTETRSHWREPFVRIRHIPVLDRVHAYIHRLSPGDRVIFYVLAILVGTTSFWSVFVLEQSLLVQIPAYGGSLTEGVVGNPQFINPLLAITDADRDLQTLTYSGLMGLSGSGELIPMLAKSYTISADGKTYTFVLRPNEKFSDGSPVTANDVVFTIKRAQDSALKSPEYADWSGVNVVAVDSETVRFTLSEAYAPFLGLTTLGILPEHLWKDISSDEFPFSPLETNPVGTGPFKVSSISRDASGLIKNVVLDENPYYVFGRPYLNNINFNFYQDTENLALALSNGSIESAYGIPGKRTLTAPYARVFGVFFNSNQNQVYARSEVRKALALALDRQAIVSNVLDGYATPIMGPVPPGGSTKQVPVPTLSDP